MKTVSIIIPVKPGGTVAACEHIKRLMPDDVSYEVLLAEGCAPSSQRNLAAREAGGEILYFLDDDALIAPKNFVYCCDGLRDPMVAVVGGPSLTPPGDNWLQQLFGYALASKMGSGAVCNRYRAKGNIRNTTDRELILCNLAIRRTIFEKLGGFNECLYPNEENEFLDRAVSAGYGLIYNPSMYVYRSQRQTLTAFVRQMFSYGRGRGQQTLISRSFSVTSFIPLFFVVYLVVTLVCIKYLLLFVPLVLYLLAAIVSALAISFQRGRLLSLLLVGIYPIMHTVNGVGLLWGLINGRPVARHDSAIRITRIKKFGESYRTQ